MELTIEATLPHVATVTAWMDEALEAHGCAVKSQMQLDIAMDELFGNIANYAYAPGVGSVTVSLDFDSRPGFVVLTFTDSGVPYDPLAKADPDITLSAEDRPIGGLGIFMVKKTMDEMAYVYEDGQNKLTVVKALG